MLRHRRARVHGTSPFPQHMSSSTHRKAWIQAGSQFAGRPLRPRHLHEWADEWKRSPHPPALSHLHRNYALHPHIVRLDRHRERQPSDSRSRFRYHLACQHSDGEWAHHRRRSPERSRDHAHYEVRRIGG